SPDEVDAVMREAAEAGATIGRAASQSFWGGYSGVFRDPDGHPWEVAHNPRWTLNEDGSISLPD
ncbi:MAG TPA: VOC family protein, partial [Solirubrobacterales bacterium]|nr:VOC family protein [Solirubrobacterales bacterium]